MLLAALGNGCLCVGGSDKGSSKGSGQEKRPEPEPTPQDKTEKCLKTCGQDRWGCQVYCSRDDNECTRACVAAYDKCIDVCGGAKK